MRSGAPLPTAIVLLLLCSPLCAAVELAGEIHGYFEKQEYLVTGPITIPAGTTLSFAPGTILRFAPGTWITVRGGLLCRGRVSEPIVFSSAVSGSGESASSGWTGIVQADSTASLMLDYVNISHAVVGIKLVYIGEQISITNAVFHSNQKAHVQLNHEIVSVPEKRAFTLHSSRQGHSLASREELAAAGTLSMPSGERGGGVGRTAFRWISAGVGAAALVTGLVLNSRASSYDQQYDNATDPAVAARYDEDRHAAATAGYLFLGLGAAGAVGFTLSWLF